MKKKVLLFIALILVLLAALVVKDFVFHKGENDSAEVSEGMEVKEERFYLDEEQIPDRIFVTRMESGKEYSGYVSKITNHVVSSSGRRKVTYVGLIFPSDEEEGK